MFETYFPLGIAEGKAFLGRQKETRRLLRNLEQGYHSLLLSPRRYGKTSLALHVIQQVNMPWAETDIFLAYDDIAFERKCLNGIQNLLEKVGAVDQTLLQRLVDYFKQAKKTWTVGFKGLKLEINPNHHHDVPENLLEALEGLEHILAYKQQNAILFIDEFQEIANLKNARAIEGAIRHFAQRTRYTRLIFSGSHRHMLKHIFHDQTRPLYALCDEIHLGRLSPGDYRPYLNEVAQQTWGIDLSPDAFNAIMHYTECHPRYVYNLCMYLWQQGRYTEKPPTVEDVDQAWAELVYDKLKDIRELLTHRASSHIKVLAMIAVGQDTALTSHAVQTTLGITSAAIVKALRVLEAEDYIEKTEADNYRIIDPCLKATLSRYGADFFIQ